MKGVIIKGRAESVTLKSEKVFNKFQSIIEAQRKEKKARLDLLEDEVASLKGDVESFSKIRQSVRSTREIMGDVFTEAAIVALNEKFEEIIKECQSEEEVIRKFLQHVNAIIKDATDTESTKVETKYKEWSNNLRYSYNDLEQSLSYYEAPHLEYQELPKELCEYEVLHTLITSKVFWGTLLTGGAIIPAVAVGVALPALGVGAGR